MEEVFRQTALEIDDNDTAIGELSSCCNAACRKLVSRTRKDSWPEGGITLEHVEENPRHFRTKAELRAYCKEHGLQSGALL